MGNFSKGSKGGKVDEGDIDAEWKKSPPLPSEKRTTSRRLPGKWFKPGPESGLDCLICAEFARPGEQWLHGREVGREWHRRRVEEVLALDIGPP